MISIGPYLQTARPEQRSNSLERVTAMLLQGIAMHSYKFEDAEYAEFQATVRKLRDQIGTAENEDELFLTAGAAIHALERHNNMVERSIVEQRQETQNIISLMTQALLRTVNGNVDSVRYLAAIGNDFSLASKTNDLRTLKDRLATSLNSICEESKRQQMQLSLLRSDITRVAGHPDVRAIVETAELDPITSLPNAESAAKSIVAAWDSGIEAYLVLFAMERVDSVNVRFGFQAGDEMLQVFSQHVLKSLHTEDQLFRWRGPYFIGLFEKRLTEPQMANEINRIANTRIEHTIRVKDRDVMLPVSASWTMFSLRSAQNVDDLLSRIADFLSTRVFASAAPRRDR